MNINEIVSVAPEVVSSSRANPDLNISRYDFFANPSNSPVENTFAASDELRKTLTTCQRFARIAPSVSVPCVLKGLGFGSAAEVAGLSETGFVAVCADARHRYSVSAACKGARSAAKSA